MKAYKVLIIYYVEAGDDAEARRIALDLQDSGTPIEIQESLVEVRTERCDCCHRLHTRADMRRCRGEYLCYNCDETEHPEEYPGSLR
jgi:hypothetical protein